MEGPPALEKNSLAISRPWLPRLVGRRMFTLGAQILPFERFRVECQSCRQSRNHLVSHPSFLPRRLLSAPWKAAGSYSSAVWLSGVKASAAGLPQTPPRLLPASCASPSNSFRNWETPSPTPLMMSGSHFAPDRMSITARISTSSHPLRMPANIKRSEVKTGIFLIVRPGLACSTFVRRLVSHRTN